MEAAGPIIQFLKNGIIDSSEGFSYCQNRGESAARLSKWMTNFKAFGLASDKSAILTAIIGELTNNTFDHNLGHWHDPSGCFVGIVMQSEIIRVFIADRGQGIISSLGRSLEGKYPPQEVLRRAFEERISGRAPERRGNGLKFVLHHIKDNRGSLLCYSQGAIYSFGKSEGILPISGLPKDFGTFIYIQWRVQ